ncbi:MAG: 3-keto-disaccharide hydrolase [Ilyomonas sp.]
MKKIVLAAAGFCLCFIACNSSGNEGSTADSTLGITTGEPNTNDTAWVSLFDGQTLQGWHTYGQTSPGSAWSVDSGAIHLDAFNKSNEKDRGDLVTDQEFTNFDLELDWKISNNGNSGIIFYVQEDTTKYKNTYNSGIEMQVLDNAGHPDAKIIKHRAGDIYDLITSSPETVKPAGEWNHVEIRSQNGKLDCYLNGTQVISTELWTDEWKKLVANSKFKNMPGFGTFKTGHIVLQDHGDEVWYKNIRIKRL